MRPSGRVLVTAVLFAAVTIAQADSAAQDNRDAQKSVAPSSTPERESGKAKAEIQELVTDRPDFTESTEIAPRGWVQWESGFAFDRRGRDRAVTVGAPLFRIGLAKRLELRLGTDGYLLQRSVASGTERGLADSSIGIKYKLFSERRFLPALSFIPAVSMPTGKVAFTSGARDPEVKIAWAKDVLLGFSLSGNINMASLTDEVGRYAQRAYTISAGHDLGRGFGGYWELYRFSVEERGTGAMAIFQSGMTRAVGVNTQLDFSVARRLTRVGPDWTYSFGFATRQPLGLVLRKVY